MPHMQINWDFTPPGGPTYHCGVRDVKQEHVPTALSLGATFVEEAKTAERSVPALNVENHGSQTAEKTPPVKKAEAAKKPAVRKPAVRKPSPSLEKYNADVKRAKALGFIGTANKDAIEDFLADQDAKAAADQAEREAETAAQEASFENHGSQTP